MSRENAREGFRERIAMAARKNVFRCQNVDCGCELTVTRGPKRFLQDESRTPVCICGSSMDRISPPQAPALI
jgi:hypothetical protein